MTRRNLRSKRRKILRVRRPISSFRSRQVVSMSRTFNYNTLAGGYWQPATTTTADFWKYYSFTFADLPSNSEFKNVFDQYKINAIKVVFRPRFDNFAGNDTTDTTAPGVSNQAGCNMHVIVDPQSTTSPSGTYTRSNLNTFLEAGSRVKSYNGNKAITVYFKPNIPNAILAASTASTQWTKPRWIQTNIDNVLHTGFHAFAQDFNMTGTFGQSWDVFVTYYMQFRGWK